jgi:hypothetical protein
MSSTVYSTAVVGVEAFEMEIEVHVGWGNTDKIAVVGLPDTSVKESKDRSPPPLVPAFCAGRMETDYDQSGPGRCPEGLGSQAALPADAHCASGECGGSRCCRGRRCLRSLFAFSGRAFFARGYRLGSGALNQRLARRRIGRTGVGVLTSGRIFQNFSASSRVTAGRIAWASPSQSKTTSFS